MRTLLLCACLLRDATAFLFPTPPQGRITALAARSKTSNNRWADRRSNYAIESSWRNPASPDVVYEIDRKVVVRHLPAVLAWHAVLFERFSDGTLTRDAATDAFLMRASRRPYLVNWGQAAACTFLRKFMSLTDANAMLGRGKMHVLSAVSYTHLTLPTKA